MQFTEVFKGIWESDVQQIVAVAISRETDETLKAVEPMFHILGGGDGEGFRVYRTLFGGRRQYLKTKKTLAEAICFAEKEV